MTGTGAFLWLQVRLVRHIREEVDDLGALERLLGKMTFLWRSADEKLYLALSDVPEEFLEHCELVSRWLLGIGVVGVALVTPWFFKRWWRG